MTRSRFFAAAALALACAAPALARAPGAAPASGRVPAQTRDTALTFATGDRVHVSTWPMGASGTDLCAALGRGIRGVGKTLYAQSDEGRGMPTIQRFPTVGTTPYCTPLTQSAGDSVTFTMTKLVRTRDGRLGRYTVGSYRVDSESLRRRRVTFRWDGEGMDTVPSPGR